MKRLLIIAFALCTAFAANAQIAQTQSNESLQQEHIAFIKKLYDDFFINGTSWDDITPYYIQHCSKQVVQTVKDSYDYDCDDGDCYGWWIFRDMSEDSSGDIKVIVTHDHDNWYNAKYIDLETVNVKIRIEGSGDNLKITGLKNSGYEVDVE